MICKNCGAKIKDNKNVICSECGEKILNGYEGNGFYDIFSNKNEREKSTYHHSTEQEQVEKMDEKLILELINTYKTTNKLLKKQLAFKRIIAILSVIFIAISFTFTISFMRYSSKFNTLSDNLLRLHSSTNEVEQTKNESKDDTIVQTKADILYSIELIDATDEQLQLFEKDKEIKINDSVLGQVVGNEDGKIFVKADVVKDKEKSFPASNKEMELKSGQEYEFSVDDVKIKGKLNMKENERNEN